MKKKLISFLVLVVFMFSFFPNVATAVELQLESPSVVLIEASSGKILYEKNSEVKRAPASVTKLMTLLVAIEAVKEGRGNYEDIIIASENAWRLGGSQIYLEPGEEMFLKELLIAIAVGSANDACVAVAEHLYGTHDAFVEAMNKKAEKLGLKNTHFINAYGLPAEGHYTSAKDMAIIGKEALKHKEIIQLTSIKHYKLRENTSKPFQLDNTNKLLWWYKGADGFKTGWIGEESGFCLASTAERDGLRLISVVLGAPQRKGNFRDSMILFNYGFASFMFKEFIKQGQEIGEVKVGKGDKDFVAAIVSERVGVVLPKGKDKNISSSIDLLPMVNAPIKKGQKIGEVIIKNENMVIAKFDVNAKEDVKRGSIWYQYTKMFRELNDFD